MENHVSRRIQAEMARLEWNIDDLRNATGWTAHRTRQVMEGKGRPLNDFEVLRVSVLFRCTPAYIYYGSEHLHNVPIGHQGPFETLHSLWSVTLEQELTQELESELAKRVLQGAKRKRTNAGLPRHAVYDELRQLVSRCPQGGECHCAFPGGRDGQCPYWKYFEE